MTGPRVLTLDIETRPAQAWTWGLHKAFIGIDQVIAPGAIISFAAKWLDSKRIEFWSDHHDGHDAMIRRAYALLNEADVVVHYNGERFDVPHLNREFDKAELTPPSPFRQVDLLKVARRRFKADSYKLDWQVRDLGLGAKVKHEGWPLWQACIDGDPKAWARMRRYNIQDVKLTEALFLRWRAWIPSLPPAALFADDVDTRPACTACGSAKVEKRGYAFTDQSKYQRYHCLEPKCGKWFKGTKAVARLQLKGVA